MSNGDNGDPLARLARWLGKRRALKFFLTALPRQLVQDYGHAGPYLPEQVGATIRRHRPAAGRQAHYALAIFCEPEQLKLFWREHGQPHDRAHLRRELGRSYFNGDPDFSLGDIGRYSAGHSGESAADGHSGHGAAHHGGGEGGGHH